MNSEFDSFFNRFKKHYSHYLLGVVIPALINGASIPVFKNLLGAAAYGRYALYFNALLISNLLVSGWLSQSALRFYVKASDKHLFARQVLFLSFLVGGIIFLPAVAISWQDVHNITTSLLIGIALFLAAVQLPLQAVTQSHFQSKSIVFAEAIRTTTWFGISLLLLKLGFAYLQSLFTALCISYFLSILYLCRRNVLFPFGTLKPVTGVSHTFKMLSRYGWPFSLWFIFFYLTGYIDKLFVLHHFGPTVQGHYSALFDFLSKSLGLALAPVTVAVMPLLTEAHENGRHNEVKTLLRKLIGWEIGVLALLCLLYLMVGHKILFYILHIPTEKSFIHAGLLVIVGTMVWQIALLIQKPVELSLRSTLLLTRMTIAIAIQLLFYYSPVFTNSLLKFPAGYCLSAVVYLLFVSVSSRRKSLL